MNNKTFSPEFTGKLPKIKAKRDLPPVGANGQIDGAWREGKLWFIPDNVSKSADGRIRGRETLLAQIERKKLELDGRRPLTVGEAARLNEGFMIEYTYNSNAIEGNTLTLRETDIMNLCQPYNTVISSCAS